MHACLVHREHRLVLSVSTCELGLSLVWTSRLTVEISRSSDRVTWLGTWPLSDDCSIRSVVCLCTHTHTRTHTPTHYKDHHHHHQNHHRCETKYFLSVRCGRISQGSNNETCMYGQFTTTVNEQTQSYVPSFDRCKTASSLHFAHRHSQNDHCSLITMCVIHGFICHTVYTVSQKKFPPLNFFETKCTCLQMERASAFAHSFTSSEGTKGWSTDN